MLPMPIDRQAAIRFTVTVIANLHLTDASACSTSPDKSEALSILSLIAEDFQIGSGIRGNNSRIRKTFCLFWCSKHAIHLRKIDSGLSFRYGKPRTGAAFIDSSRFRLNFQRLVRQFSYIVSLCIHQDSFRFRGDMQSSGDTLPCILPCRSIQVGI